MSIELGSHEAALSASEFKLTLFPEPPGEHNPLSRIDHLAKVLEFLRDHLFPFLPQSATFALSLCKPITAAILNQLLIPSLPSTLHALPKFLKLVQKAVDFERDYIGGLLGDDSLEKEVKTWADGVGAHYERKRRVDLLERARDIVTREVGDKDYFSVAVVVIEDTPEEPEEKAENGIAPAPEPIPAVEEDAWGFEEEPTAPTNEKAVAEENGWDFDDEVEPEPEVSVDPPPAEGSKTPTEEDPSDAWGWNEDVPPLTDGDESTDSSAWDDPWGDEPSEPTPQPIIKPKAATRLEKLSNRGRQPSSASSSTVASPVPTSVPPPTPAMPILARQATTHNPPPPISQPSEQEWYMASGRAKEIKALVEEVLSEASQLTSSKVLSSTSHHTPVGSILSQTSSFVLELYRALYPVAFASTLSTSPERAFYFSNDCLWLSGEVKHISNSSKFPPSAKDKLVEAHDRLRVIADSWYEDSIVSLDP